MSLRGNPKVETIVVKIEEKIKEILNDDVSTDGEIPSYNIYFLDGKDFEDISKFFQEIFFKEKSRKIWEEEVDNGKTIEDIIKEKLEEYATQLKTKIEEKGIKDKLRSFLVELNEIVIRPVFEPKDIKIEPKVQLLEKSGKEISVDKKSDGTKRRITMALLEYKKAVEGGPELYVFDEPDTHLHVRAQVELLNIIGQFNTNDKQVIISTHSPFIINSVRPKQIRLLELKDGETKVKLIEKSTDIERILNTLGIENIDLFFSKRILIVEGETEEKFIPLIYEKIYKKTLRSVLVKVINRREITDVPRFAEVLLNFVKPEEIFILVDNDADEETRELIEKLGIPEETNSLLVIKNLRTPLVQMLFIMLGKDLTKKWVDRLVRLGLLKISKKLRTNALTVVRSSVMN
ncbi:MAG: putative ATP-dependent endonuclease of the family [Archaeoglobus sp.]|nr:AAA family ATPase [Archaeoglobus sp.]MDI3497459.1 putative ATP-dependent endonuclease of the family [Archaeoglobus sp.]